MSVPGGSTRPQAVPPAASTGAVIRLRGVSKRFSVLSGGLGRRRRKERVVLRDIDLELAAGQSLAILGANGAGKSTLLKLIAGILQPTSGEITVNGNFGALIELGAGFHPEQNALENLRAAATLMHVPDERVGTVTENALDFSGLADHARKPLKHYSSGMVVRLGFALIAAVKPAILLSDEVLAVGDESFQKRCIAWLQGYLAEGGTLLLVSHNLYHVQKLCERAIWVHGGTIKEDGDAFDTVQTYLAFHEGKLREAGGEGTGDEPTPRFVPEDRTSHAAGEAVVLALEASDLVRTCRLRRLSGDLIWEGTVPAGAGEVILPTSALLPGRYQVEIVRAGATRGPARLFRIQGRSREFGSLRLPHRWE